MTENVGHADLIDAMKDTNVSIEEFRQMSFEGMSLMVENQKIMNELLAKISDRLDEIRKLL